MRTVTDWQQFDTRQEAKALGDYIAAKWDGITAEEAQTLALHAFHRGWDAVGEYFDAETVDGVTILSAQHCLDRSEMMRELGYTVQMRSTDGVREVLSALARLHMSVKKPQYFEEGVDPLIEEALLKLGMHLKKARPKGWKGARPTVYRHNQEDKDLFTGVATKNPVGPHFIEWISLAYVKSGVSHHDDDAFTMLVGAMYAHGFKTRSMVNGEAMGKVTASIDPHQSYVGPKQKVTVAHVPFVECLLKKYQKDALKRIEWTYGPSSELTSQLY